MSCRHSLANTTCSRCYPNMGGVDSNGRPQVTPGPEADYEPNMDGPGAVPLSDEERLRVELERTRRAMVEMRRTAVNFFDLHGDRCDDDDCNHFATYRRVKREVTMNACDYCIGTMREMDQRAESKGCETRPEWKERDDANAVRELEKASQAVGRLI